MDKICIDTHKDNSSQMLTIDSTLRRELDEVKIRVNNRGWDYFGLVAGIPGCLSGDTIIKGQSKTLQELYDSGIRNIDTISIKEFINKKKEKQKHPRVSQSEISYSGEKDVYEIELENGKKVLATEKHIFFNNKFKEVMVSDLKVGDNLKCYPIDYREKYLEKAAKFKQKERDKHYDYRFICKKCGTLAYVEKIYPGISKKFCKNCKKKKNIRREHNWFEWEDNILRQCYYDLAKKKLLKLLPLKGWGGIKKRAFKLKISRNKDFMGEKNRWTSKNNPMKNSLIRKKVSKILKEKYRNGTKKLSGIALKSQMGLIKKQNHPNWLGGISFEPYDQNWDEKFKEKIRKRDNRKCVECGKEEIFEVLNGQRLCVHHINYNKNQSTLFNCVSLCNSCHCKTNYKREYWEKRYNNYINYIYNKK